MSLKSRVSVSAVAGFVLAGGVVLGGSMTKAQREGAEQVEAITIPVPGEFFVAVSKAAQPGWGSFVKAAELPTTTSRSQLALILGMLVADGYVAVEAQDGQAVKNVGKDIIAQAKKLNVSQSVLGRSNSINDFAENNDWNALREELEATQNEVKLDMAEQSDDRLVTLVTLGAWIRGVEIASAMVDAEYSENTARLLRQPAILEYLIAQIDRLPERAREDEMVMKVRAGLEEVLPRVEPETPSAEDVKALHATMAGLIALISGGKEGA